MAYAAWQLARSEWRDRSCAQCTAGEEAYGWCVSRSDRWQLAFNLTRLRGLNKFEIANDMCAVVSAPLLSSQLFLLRLSHIGELGPVT